MLTLENVQWLNPALKDQSVIEVGSGNNHYRLEPEFS